MDNQDPELVSFSFTFGSPNSSSCTEGGESSMPSPVTIFPEISGDQFESQRQFITLELQRLIERYNDAFCRLHHTVGYVDSLRKENLLLATEKFRLLSLIEEQERSSVPPFTEITSSSSNIVAGYDGNLRQNLEAERSEEPNPDGEANTGECIPNRPRNALPKSISIRSCEFLAARRPSPRDSEMSFIRGRHPLRLRLPAPSSLQNVGEVEVDAYNQGMTKTKLCNKWEKMGICPYAERCWFAHDIQELRPVVRPFLITLCLFKTNQEASNAIS